MVRLRNTRKGKRLRREFSVEHFNSSSCHYVGRLFKPLSATLFLKITALGLSCAR